MTNYERYDIISERFAKAFPGVPFHLLVSGDDTDSWLYDNKLTWIDGPTIFEAADLFEDYEKRFTYHQTDSRECVMKKRQTLLDEGHPDDGSIFEIVPFYMGKGNVGYDLRIKSLLAI